MPQSKVQIVKAIEEYILTHGGDYSEWYVGITRDIKFRLFGDHNVHEDDDLWIFCHAYSNEAARKVESYFVNILDTDGGTGGGDEDTTYVYAYKKSLHTKP